MQQCASLLVSFAASPHVCQAALQVSLYSKVLCSEITLQYTAAMQQLGSSAM